MDMNEINSLDAAAIVKRREELKAELFGMKFRKHTSGIEKPHELKNLKKDIARLNTALNQKQRKSE